MRKKLIKETILKSLSIVILMLVCMAYNYVGIQAATDVEEITTNTEISGSVDRNEVKYYKFVVSKTGYFNISMKTADLSDTNCPNFGILNSEYEPIDSYSVSARQTTALSPNYAFKKGTEIYLKVSFCGGYGQSIEHYKFTINEVETDNWEEEYNDSVISANVISTDKEYYGRIMNSEDVDYYKFVINKTGYFNISMNGTNTSNPNCPNFEILDSKYEPIDSYKGRTDASLLTVNYAFKKGTEIYLKVSLRTGYGKNTENYKFTINEVEADNWEQEYNNTVISANEISLNKEYYGQTMNSNDVDYYKFTLSQPSVINFDFARKDVSTSSVKWNIYLMNSESKKLDYTYISSLQKSLVLPKGSYYICVQEYDSIGVDYKLKLTSKPINTKALTIKSIKSAKKNIVIKWNKQNDGSKYAVTVGTNKKFSGKTGKFYFESGSTGGKLTYFYSDKWGYNKEAFKKKKTYYVKVNKYYEDAFGNVHNGKSVIKKVTIK